MQSDLVLARFLKFLTDNANKPLYLQLRMASSSSSKLPAIEIPPGFRLHTENTTRILLSSDEAFLNPVQEFNRDLSVACIRVWGEELNRVKEEKWRKGQGHKGKKRDNKEGLSLIFLAGEYFVRIIQHTGQSTQASDVHMKSPDEPVPSSVANVSNIERHSAETTSNLPPVSILVC